jgi:hypothetical protein
MFLDVGAGVHVEDALETSTVIIQNNATGNQTVQTGFAVDLTGLPRKYNSVKVVVLGDVTLATARTFAFKTDLQNRSATSGTGRFLAQGTQEGEGVFRTAKKFVRIVLTPTDAGGDWINTTASTADSFFRVRSGFLVFGTPDEMPASG